MIESLPLSSKVWVFMSNEKFTLTQEEVIKTEVSLFLSSWQTHGKNVVGFFELRYSQFIVIAADESIEIPSGCSIDSLTQIIKQLEQKIELSLLNRSLVGFLNHANDKEIFILPLNEFRQKIKENSFEPNISVFNPSIATVGEYRNNWIQPLQESWARAYIQK